MRERRGLDRVEDLCSGPGKLTQALGIGLGLNDSSLLDGPIKAVGRPAEAPEPRVIAGERIGITKAAELPWRYADEASRHCVAAGPPAMRGIRAA